MLGQSVASDRAPMETDKKTTATVTLGEYLATIRRDRGKTLRQVEEESAKAVSNAYLSQIENDKIQKPSPNTLYALANLYGISYDSLMERAGYISTTRGPGAERPGRAPTFVDEVNLTAEEEARLLRFLNFIRSEKS